MSRAKYGEPLRWLNAALLQETDECIEWPFGLNNNGYGQVRIGKQRSLVHRYICLQASGAPPSERHTDVAHSCDNRKCCNKRHLRHATSLENSADAVNRSRTLKGERSGRSKLTDEEVRAIKRALPGLGPSVLARQYRVTPKAICLIRDGVNWASVVG